MGGEDDDAAFLGEVLEGLEDEVGVGVVEGCGGFVGEDDGGGAEGETGEGEALLFAAAEGVSGAFFVALEAELGEDGGVVGGGAEEVGAGGDVEVFGDGGVGNEGVVLEDEADGVGAVSV